MLPQKNEIKTIAFIKIVNLIKYITTCLTASKLSAQNWIPFQKCVFVCVLKLK